MKFLNLFFVLLFVFSASLQYNDPDPYLWMPIYFFGAYLCYQAMQRKYQPRLYLAGLAVYVAYAVFLFFDTNGVLSWIVNHQAESLTQSMEASKPWIEETREFFGLLLLIVALGSNMLWLRKQQKTPAAAQATERAGAMPGSAVADPVQ